MEWLVLLILFIVSGRSHLQGPAIIGSAPHWDLVMRAFRSFLIVFAIHALTGAAELQEETMNLSVPEFPAPTVVRIHVNRWTVADLGTLEKSNISRKTSRGIRSRKFMVEENANDTTSAIDIKFVAPGAGDCSVRDIGLVQQSEQPSGGLPLFNVQIQNSCLDPACQISNIHVRCGMFSSGSPLNPHVFRRVNPDDCLVNDGLPLSPSNTISFTYSSIYMIPMTVFSGNVLCRNSQ
jgi:hypothetical protein